MAGAPFDEPLDRRTVLGTGALVGGLGYGVVRLGRAADGDAAPPDAAAWLSRLSSLVLPQTDTMRAGAPADVAFMLRALEARMFDTSFALLGRLQHVLDGGSAMRFLDQDPARQRETLAAFDAAVFAGRGPHGSGWPQIKALILTAYYTSEEGAARELRYDLVPGRYVPDLPVDAATRAVSSDWFGVHPVAVEAR